MFANKYPSIFLPQVEAIVYVDHIEALNSFHLNGHALGFRPQT